MASNSTVRYVLLATDYDGTLASHGRVRSPSPRQSESLWNIVDDYTLRVLAIVVLKAVLRRACLLNRALTAFVSRVDHGFRADFFIAR